MTELRQRDPRVECPGFLAFLRTKPCCVCHRPPRSAAAHIRMSDAEHGTTNPGMLQKPHDRLAVPLCDPGCHKEAPGAQHAGNERAFWQRVGKNPFELAAAYWAEFVAEHGEPELRKPRRRNPRPKPKKATKRPWGTRTFPKGRGLNGGSRRFDAPRPR